MREFPMVSVIITLHNYRDYVRKCVSSCLKQTYPNVEVIVVDDVSTDGGAEALEEYVAAKFPRANFRLLRNKKNVGYPASRNVGIRASKGEFIRPLDADDRLPKDGIEIAMNGFAAHPGADMVYGDTLRWFGGHKYGGKSRAHCHSSAQLYRREVFEQFGLYYEPLLPIADKELIYRFGIHPKSPLPLLITAVKVSGVVSHYRRHNRAMHTLQKTKYKKSREKMQRIFDRRIEQLKREGVTPQNTEFLDEPVS